MSVLISLPFLVLHSFGPGQSQRVETSHPAFFQTAKEGNQTRIREFKLAKTTLTVRVVLQVCTHEESDRSLAISIQKPNLGFVSFVCFVTKHTKHNTFPRKTLLGNE